LTSLGNNLEDSVECGLVPGLDDQPDTDPQALPLALNGGTLAVHALADGSLAIDAGDNATCPAVDQRGATRPVDGDGNGTAICDIGAFEYGGILPPIYLPFINK